MPASLVALAQDLLAQAQQLEAVLETNSIGLPSFDHDTLDALPDSAQALRARAVDVSHDLQQLLRGARQSGLDIAFGWTDLVILRTVWRHRLAHAVPMDGCASYEEVAATSGLSRSLVVRLVRAAMPLRLFYEATPGQVRHTALSRLLATDEGFYHIIGLQVEDLGPASIHLPAVWQEHGDAVGDAHQSAFARAHGGRSLFDVLAAEPERARRFDAAMKYSAENKLMAFADIVHAWDWAPLDRPGARLVDVGGGYGQMAQALARHTQYLTFTVQDLPHAIAEGRRRLPVGLEDRISFTAHNFLEQQQPSTDPPTAILISRCLHNWSDAVCMTILRGLIPALRSDSKLLIWDVVLDAEPVHNLSMRFPLQQDIIMATTSNGKDRSTDEWRHMLSASDARFAIETFHRPKASQLSLIVVAWDDQRECLSPHQYPSSSTDP